MTYNNKSVTNEGVHKILSIFGEKGLRAFIGGVIEADGVIEKISGDRLQVGFYRSCEEVINTVYSGLDYLEISYIKGDGGSSIIEDKKDGDVSKLICEEFRFEHKREQIGLLKGGEVLNKSKDRSDDWYLGLIVDNTNIEIRGKQTSTSPQIEVNGKDKEIVRESSKRFGCKLKNKSKNSFNVRVTARAKTKPMFNNLEGICSRRINSRIYYALEVLGMRDNNGYKMSDSFMNRAKQDYERENKSKSYKEVNTYYRAGNISYTAGLLEAYSRKIELEGDDMLVYFRKRGSGEILSKVTHIYNLLESIGLTVKYEDGEVSETQVVIRILNIKGKGRKLIERFRSDDYRRELGLVLLPKTSIIGEDKDPDWSEGVLAARCGKTIKASGGTVLAIQDRRGDFVYRVYENLGGHYTYIDFGNIYEWKVLALKSVKEILARIPEEEKGVVGKKVAEAKEFIKRYGARDRKRDKGKTIKEIKKDMDIQEFTRVGTFKEPSKVEISNIGKCFLTGMIDSNGSLFHELYGGYVINIRAGIGGVALLEELQNVLGGSIVRKSRGDVYLQIGAGSQAKLLSKMIEEYSFSDSKLKVAEAINKEQDADIVKIQYDQIMKDAYALGFITASGKIGDNVLELDCDVNSLTFEGFLKYIKGIHEGRIDKLGNKWYKRGKGVEKIVSRINKFIKDNFSNPVKGGKK